MLAAAALSGPMVQAQDLPRFTSSVELTSLDVSVFEGNGRPVADLKPDDFVVRIDGAPRRVISAEWVPLEAPAGPSATPLPPGYSSNERVGGGRLILIVIDQPNIRFGGAAGIRKTVHQFIDQLQPSDRAAVIGIGLGAASTPFTADHERLKKAVEQMGGQYRSLSPTLHTIGIAEALDVRRDMPGALGNLISRECRDWSGRLMDGIELDACSYEVEQEARRMATEGAADGRVSINTLETLLTTLKAIDAPKTLILVSEGFVIDNDRLSVTRLGMLSAAARTSIYALKLDEELFTLAAWDQRAPMSRMDDRAARAEGLELLATASRGTLFNIVGSAKGVFDRIAAELSGYYLIGVDAGPTDKDGKAHPIHVEVNRKGATVRTRRALLASPDEIRRARSPREAMVTALASPLPVSALPMRVATFSLQGPETDKVQVLIHADIGTDYAASRLVALGYVITDRDGRTVDSHVSGARLRPIMNGVPSTLQFSGGASLPPGDYLLKFAVAEGDRVGTVEHSFRAGTAVAGQVSVSDLMVGGPPGSGTELLQPTVGYSVFFGSLHGYVEAYGDELSAIRATYEVVADGRSDPLLESDVPPHMAAGGRRAIFTHVMPVRQLPPGKYTLRVTLTSSTEALKTLEQPFEVAAPAVLMTSASATAAAAAPSEVYLPVSETMLSRAFDASEAARESTIQAFRERVLDAARPAFDRGVQSLAAGAYGDAEASFKAAVSADEDSSPVLAYLAATFAAAGQDTEAASAWQTALIGGSDFPEIYDWLAGALMRNRDLAVARGTLEEATEKWPSDDRFARPMALVYATFGQGREAVRTLDRHLARHPDDTEALALGVEWIYQLHAAGAVARSAAEDLKLARSYAASYNKTKGPQSALVRRWMEALEKKK